VSDQDQDKGDGLISLLTGIGVGVVLGGVVALLLAPQSGSQTRTQLRDSVDEALTRLRDSMEELRVKVEEAAANARDAVTSRRGAAPAPDQGGVAGATDESPDTEA
jgi:gas vesicle protein